jgi:hypothetical protein
VIEQVPKFNCLGAEISAKRNLKQEARTQATSAARISGCLYNLIWLNKYMSAESKVCIYKPNVRPVLTYASETSRNNKHPTSPDYRDEDNKGDTWKDA